MKIREQFKKFTRAELLTDPCELCKDKQMRDRPCRPADDAFSCGTYWEILFEKWDETRDLIREHAGRKK